MASGVRNGMAAPLKAPHKPGEPLILANVYDILSARAVAALSSCKALATASYAVAKANGVEDDDMDLETNLRAVRGIVAVAKEFDKPSTVDIQDAYGPRLEEAVEKLLDLGVAGINLEDCDKRSQKICSQEELLFALSGLWACDTLVHDGALAEVIERGKAYLTAGATTVFVWGGSKRGFGSNEVQEMVRAFDGRLNVSMIMSEKGLNVTQISKLGVEGISVGPQIQFMAMDTFAK